ncbi:MAG TPA: pesticin C-terminus-like muramidase [Oligoflexia bacterium]|nr:pesticin C-terminus-like muramidase [Oligoflexia bacterium]HMP27489.1 pesticin C-terminus-like muramidase [Oligoflexia bacterium]
MIPLIGSQQTNHNEPINQKGNQQKQKITYYSNSPYLKVPRGQLTFDLEGNEGEKFFSRVAHKPPGAASGVTIGRGYDMGFRSKTEAKNDLIAAGVPESDATLLSEAAGLRGNDAEKFLKENDLPIISLQSQQKLFSQIVYPKYEQETKRVVKNSLGANGEEIWQKLDQKIIDVLVDLTYRGDNTPATRNHFIEPLKKNDLEGFKKKLAEGDVWQNVPPYRSQSRLLYLDS